MKIKTAELTGAVLDWAVAKCEGLDAGRFYGVGRYSTDWAQGGPIIEREGISVRPDSYTEHKIKAFDSVPLTWKATRYWVSPEGKGQTPLIAAMRCYVASNLGEEVAIPEDILQHLTQT